MQASNQWRVPPVLCLQCCRHTYGTQIHGRVHTTASAGTPSRAGSRCVGRDTRGGHAALWWAHPSVHTYMCIGSRHAPHTHTHMQTHARTHNSTCTPRACIHSTQLVGERERRILMCVAATDPRPVDHRVAVHACNLLDPTNAQRATGSGRVPAREHTIACVCMCVHTRVVHMPQRSGCPTEKPGHPRVPWHCVRALASSGC